MIRRGPKQGATEGTTKDEERAIAIKSPREGPRIPSDEEQKIERHEIEAYRYKEGQGTPRIGQSSDGSGSSTWTST